jgi:hypothetical protein
VSPGTRHKPGYKGDYKPENPDALKEGIEAERNYSIESHIRVVRKKPGEPEKRKRGRQNKSCKRQNKVTAEIVTFVH